MNKRQFLTELGLVAVGGGLALVGTDVILNRDADRRFALYNMMRELRKSMSRAEVESIIKRHEAPYIKTYKEGEDITLTVQLGGLNWLYLDLEFNSGQLISARFRGEDNQWDVPQDAPSNMNN